MKWKAIAEDYFTFNKIQRRSILIALSAIVLCLALRFSYNYFLEEKSVPADTAFLQEAERLTQPDTSRNSYAANSYRSRYKEDDEATYREPYDKSSKKYQPKGELFSFDPNTLNTEGWKRLGVRDKTIATIQNYLSKGGHFRQPDDIRRIYGLFPDEAERLVPYVAIAPTEAYPKKEFTREAGNTVTYNKPVKYSPAMVDINAADTTALIALPGIGSKLASRIIMFREKLGGFYTVDQLGETYGLPDSTFQKIKPRLIVGNFAPRKLNINTLSANELKGNPYIKWNMANAIEQYRKQHGNFTSLDDLKKIALIDEQLFMKIAPYLTIQ